jgi:hypothetical protein
MKLPNGELAVVDPEKLIGYCLNFQHPRGRNKARVFAAVGIQTENAAELRSALLHAALHGDAQMGVASVFGNRYTIDFDLVRNDKSIRIRSTWMIRVDDHLPRLTSCYVI